MHRPCFAASFQDHGSGSGDPTMLAKASDPLMHHSWLAGRIVSQLKSHMQIRLNDILPRLTMIIPCWFRYTASLSLQQCEAKTIV